MRLGYLRKNSCKSISKNNSISKSSGGVPEKCLWRNSKVCSSVIISSYDRGVESGNLLIGGEKYEFGLVHLVDDFSVYSKLSLSSCSEEGV